MKPSRPQKKKTEPVWLKLAGVFGKTASQRRETRRIQRVIDREFGQIDASYSTSIAVKRMRPGVKHE